MAGIDSLSPPGAAGGVDWADSTDYMSGGIPPQEVKVNPDGTKTVTEYAMSEDGYLAVTTTVYKVEKVTRTVSKGVAERKKWKRFGECTGKPAGLERGISTVSVDEVNIEWLSTDDGNDQEEEEANYAEMAARDIQSRLRIQRFKQRQEERKLGVANWAQKMSIEAAAKNPNMSPAPGMRPEAPQTPGAKYVPPSKRAGATGTSGGGETTYSRDDSATVRISNVSRSTEEADLEELCKVFGPIRRIFLSRDRETGESKGFAFVAYQHKDDAEKCIQRLDGYGYDHLILSVEWSKPKEPREGEAPRPTFSR